MSAPSNCCTSCCNDPELVEIPGVQGAPGNDGADGADGVSAFTTLTGNCTIPAIGDPVTITVEDNSWMAIGESIFMSDETDWGTFIVLSKNGTTAADVQFEGRNGDSSPGAVINIGGLVTPSAAPQLYGPLPNAITDSTAGVGTDGISSKSTYRTLVFYIDATAIQNGDLLTNYAFGYGFRILNFDVRCASPVTTGGKAATLNLEIGVTDLTGGVVSLTGTYAQGAAIAGSAITANNEGNASDTFSIEASAVTAFTEGAFWLILKVENVTLSDAIQTLSTHINDLITAMTP